MKSREVPFPIHVFSPFQVSFHPHHSQGHQCPPCCQIQWTPLYPHFNCHWDSRHNLFILPELLSSLSLLYNFIPPGFPHTSLASPSPHLLGWLFLILS